MMQGLKRTVWRRRPYLIPLVAGSGGLVFGTMIGVMAPRPEGVPAALSGLMWLGSVVLGGILISVCEPLMRRRKPRVWPGRMERTE